VEFFTIAFKLFLKRPSCIGALCALHLDFIGVGPPVSQLPGACRQARQVNSKSHSYCYCIFIYLPSSLGHVSECSVIDCATGKRWSECCEALLIVKFFKARGSIISVLHYVSFFAYEINLDIHIDLDEGMRQPYTRMLIIIYLKFTSYNSISDPFHVPSYATISKYLLYHLGI
jgi:hypothetical protein